MSAVTPLHGGSMLPVRPLRAALLAFIGALALVEAGAGLIVGQAWRLHEGDALSATERADLAHMLERLRVMENVVVAGALATTLLWSLVAIYNATMGARGGLRASALAAAACVGAPVLFLAFRAAEADKGNGRLIMVGAQALALYLPFWALGRVAEGVGGRSVPFMRWYLALAASFVVHDLFTAPLDLANPQQADDFGRTAMMFLVNALVVAVMGVMAAEATRALDRATAERSLTHRLLHDDANRRERPGAITFEPTPAAQATIPSLPPPASTGPAQPGPASPGPASPVAVAVAAPVQAPAMSSVATLTPPHPQPAVGAPMPPPIVPVAFPAPPPALLNARANAHAPAVDPAVDPVTTTATPPAAVAVAAPVAAPAPAAVPPVAIPALQPLTTMSELRPSTPVSVPVIVVPEIVVPEIVVPEIVVPEIVVPEIVVSDDAGSTDAPVPDDASLVEQRIEPVPAAMPSMFQPLTRPGA